MAYKDLNIREKAAIIRTAVSNGITNLADIENAYNEFAEGGSIHIKSENRGKFTAAAKSRGLGVQEFASKVLANKDNYSPTMVKRANFAKNASKWNHSEGGYLYPEDGNKYNNIQRKFRELRFMSNPDNWEQLAELDYLNWLNKQNTQSEQYYRAEDLPEIILTPDNSTINQTQDNWTSEYDLHQDYMNSSLRLKELQLSEQMADSVRLAMNKAGYEGLQAAKLASTFTPLWWATSLGDIIGNSIKGNYKLAAIQGAMDFIPAGIGKILTAPITKLGIKYIGNKALQLYDKKYFRVKPNTFTRGIGGDEGLQDLITSGVVRGNPLGTEITANAFTRGMKRNRNHFRDIMNTTGIEGIENKFYNRTLTEKEFNAIKNAAKSYEGMEVFELSQELKPKLATISSDPLFSYNSYADYTKSKQSDLKALEEFINDIKNRKASEFKGDLFITLNSDGLPLSYWYDTGINALGKDAHSYAKSKYMVRINNPEQYKPFIHPAHMHKSFQITPKLSDSNVEIFKQGLFGIPYKININDFKYSTGGPLYPFSFDKLLPIVRYDDGGKIRK